MCNSGEWSVPDRRFRMTIQYDAAGYRRQDKTMAAKVDFTECLHAMGEQGTVNVNSLHVTETDPAGNLVDEHVKFQFDRHAASWADDPKEDLLIMARGVTAGDSVRNFQVYFDTVGISCKPSVVTPLVTLLDPVIDEDQACFRVTTPEAVFDFQKQGGGFSSLLDKDGNDWLNYRPGGGSGGEYRGMPNSGVFHPGYGNAVSRVINHGPLRTTLLSETVDGRNACMWEIYAECAVFTMLKSHQPFWFLYEGTPGGTFDQDRDDVVRSSGERTPASQSWDRTEAGPRWVYFGDAESKRVLYLVHHEEEVLTDSYWAMNREMTVFGFGRAPQGYPLTPYLTKVPNRVTLGFHDGDGFDEVKERIDSSFREYRTRVIGVERKEDKRHG